MPPTNPKKTEPSNQQPGQQRPSTTKSGLPALRKDLEPARTKYEEEQDEEITVLESIYGDDFKKLDSQDTGAWHKRQRCFKIRIRSTDGLLSVVLQVEMTATYPKSTPLLSISRDEDLPDGYRRNVKRIVETKPQELIVDGGPIIYALADLIEAVLNEAAASRAAFSKVPDLLSSRETERAIQEHEAAEVAKVIQAEELKRKELEAMEEERMLNSMVENERKKREKAMEEKKKERMGSMANSTAESEKALSRQVEFDSSIELNDVSNNTVSFKTVTNLCQIRRGPSATIYTVRPIINGPGQIPILILKQTDLKHDRSDVTKSRLHELETELEKLKKIRHRNVLELYDFKVYKTTTKAKSAEPWTVSILMEYGNKGSLEELLEIAGDLPVSKARAWTIDLLDGLQFMHQSGIIHQDIQASNVMLVRDRYGEIAAKLADGSYQRQLAILSNQTNGTTNVLSVAKSAYWHAPENIDLERAVYNQKTDVWDFGIVFLNMIFGMGVLQDYTSPSDLIDSMSLSLALEEFVRKIFQADPQKRPRASELSFCEFLATDAEIMATGVAVASSSHASVNSALPVTPVRPRHNSGSNGHSGLFTSRFKEDFIDEGRLGKGGFGEVTKARKKLDGQFYAVKKIVQKPSSATMTDILKEVRLLSLLSHPYVVRYYNTWTEEIPDDGDNEAILSSNEELTASEDESSNSVTNAEFEENVTGDLDFVSSGAGGWPNIEFGYDTGEEEACSNDDDDDEEDDTNTGDGLVHKKGRAIQRFDSISSRVHKSTRTILYIQMEFCARRTLRDLIKAELYRNESQVWRYLRQILEALAYIHSMNVVHRDLKPENVFMDGAENIRIGDFGLATSQFTFGERNSSSSANTEGVDMTRSIGTVLYVAPEVRSSARGVYTSKVDMYSLGIILFEMCYPPLVGMERAQKIGRLRDKHPQLPKDLDVAEKKIQADVILSLVRHTPNDRPSAAEVLGRPELPGGGDWEETVKKTLAKLSDSNSESYTHILNSLFSMPVKQAKDFAWDMASTSQLQSRDLLLRSVVKEQIISIFRHHGALETRRDLVFPRSRFYAATTVQLLDRSGLPLQLPYDLTLPNARALAKHSPPSMRSFAFGEVYRPSDLGGRPRTLAEVDFDIVSTDALDLAMKEAETIKVMDEIIDSLPSLDSSKFSFHINHADLLQLILKFCRIESDLHDAVAEALSRHNVQWSWSKTRSELRSPSIGVSTTSLDDLEKFDFTETPQTAFERLRAVFHGSEMLDSLKSVIGHISDVAMYLDRFQTKSKCLVSPLSSMNQTFYKGGLMFQCIDMRGKRDIFAAGGRYDSLIREHRAQITRKSEACHAVGFKFPWEKVTASISSLQKSTAKAFLKKQEDLNGVWTARRCDVLVGCFDPHTLRNEGVQLVANLWSHGISAELAVDSKSPEDLQSKYAKDDPHCWIIVVKQDGMLKAKSMVRKDQHDTDMHKSQLITYLRGEIREREQLNGTYEKGRPHRHGSQVDTAGSNHDQEVRLLVADTRSKKMNRRNIVEQAQEKAASLVHSFLEGPIFAIDTTDRVLNMLRETRLSDADSWKNAIQNAPMAERKYIKEIQALLEDVAQQNKSATRNAFVYNYRTGTCIFYDLGPEASSLSSGRGKERDSSAY